MNKVSAIITAAGKNSRMREDQLNKNIPVQNKLTLPFLKNTIIETTIDNVLNTENIDECIVVLGHYYDEILPLINNIDDKRLKIVKNNPIDVGLSISLLNGLLNSKNQYVLCVTGDQPTVSSKTFNNILNTLFKSDNPQKTISILRRIDIGKLDSAIGLGMPFAANRNELMHYLEGENDNLNPILRKMYSDGFEFYGVKEDNPDELININHLEDYKSLL
ncbi:NTP transferase domain-containing protein [uncultured Methanobrevibacter sp.]|uniref:nucleotidyltransferase family protein n=1 Tax=uncultured Methanobrevibacter sp. TaxID=253161 RepID=UPI0026116D99